MHCKHVFSEIHNENCFSTQRPTEALYLTVNKKLRHSYNQFGLRVVSKKLEHNITYGILITSFRIRKCRKRHDMTVAYSTDKLTIVKLLSTTDL